MHDTTNSAQLARRASLLAGRDVLGAARSSDAGQWSTHEVGGEAADADALDLVEEAAHLGNGLCP